MSKKSRVEQTLEITRRMAEIQAQRRNLQIEYERLEGELAELVGGEDRGGTHGERIKRYLYANPAPHDAEAVARALGMSVPVARTNLARLVDAEEVERVAKGRYQAPSPDDEKIREAVERELARRGGERFTTPSGKTMIAFRRSKKRKREKG